MSLSLKGGGLNDISAFQIIIFKTFETAVQQHVKKFFSHSNSILTPGASGQPHNCEDIGDLRHVSHNIVKENIEHILLLKCQKLLMTDLIRK